MIKGNPQSFAQEIVPLDGASHDNSIVSRGSFELMSTAQSRRSQTRPYEHKYFFRQPILRQYSTNEKRTESNSNRNNTIGDLELGPLQGSRENERQEENEPEVETKGSEEKPESDGTIDWLNLFIDLMWAGIVANISEQFVNSAFAPDSSWGLGLLEFLVLFLTAFKMWNFLREFLNSFFTKDYLQSLFICWIFTLALFFANQTPYFAEKDGRTAVIATYLIVKYSIVIMELFYSIWIPTIRRELRIRTVLALPATALWIGSLKLSWPTNAALILSALLIDGTVSSFMKLSISESLFRGIPRRTDDPDAVIERFRGFFVIILGEGVNGLLFQTDWGVGFGVKLPIGVQVFIILYLLFWLFFIGDSSKTYIHALYRNQYTAVAYASLHVFLYATLLLFGDSIRYLINLGNVVPTGDEQAIADFRYSTRVGQWSTCAALSAVLLSMTALALLNQSLDAPRTLLINNRYHRLAPRIVLIVIVMCLPLAKRPSFFLIILSMCLMMGVYIWEFVASLDRGARFFEPRKNM